MATTEAVSPQRFALGSTGAGPGRFGRVQLVAIELAVIAVAAAVFVGRPLPIVLVAVAAVIVLALAVGRSRRRWAYEALAVRLRLRRRSRTVSRALRRARRTAGADDAPGPLGAELAAVMPGLTIRPVTDRDTALGVGQDELGWFAAISIAPATGSSADGQRTPRLDRLARLLTDESIPASALQLVTHRAATASANLGAQPPSEVTPDAQGNWLAVRLDPRDAAHAATQRGGGLTGVDRALAACLARVGVVLNATGVPYRVLDAAGLRQALTAACGLAPLSESDDAATAISLGPDGAVTAISLGPDGAVTVTPTGPVKVTERWTSWQAGDTQHACFTVENWPAESDPELIAELATVPGATAVDTALLLLRPATRRDDRTAVRALLRVAAKSDRLAGCVTHLLGTANRLGVRLTRLDGEHAAGVYATAPTAASPAASAWWGGR